MQNYFPFVQPSFVKLKTIYEIENFEELTDYISLNGEKVTDLDFVLTREKCIENTYIVIRRGKKKYFIGQYR